MLFEKKFTKEINFFFRNHRIYKKNYIDNNSIFRKKKILIAGGAGSIGSLLTIKLIKLNIKSIVIIDNNEYSISKLKQKIFFNPKISIKLFSILNVKSLEKIFKQNKFDIVYNCAAIKHVDICEENKDEAFRVNVKGNLNLLNFSIKYNVKKYIFISTDKANKPAGIMGKSKLEAEKYVLKKEKKIHKIVLRFPNILRSSGSLVEILYNCIIDNTIFFLRNKKLKRFFIFENDACEFITRATSLNLNNKIVLLNNIKETKIIDLIKFLKKKFNLRYCINKLPRYEKISEIYRIKKTNNQVII
jgi:UDP-N-acetylglucosamine 4,6-dehydratase